MESGVRSVDVLQRHDPRSRSTNFVPQNSTQFLRFGSAELTDASKLFILYTRHNGFLRFRRLARTFGEHRFSAAVMFSLLGTVPDRNVHRHRGYALSCVLSEILGKFRPKSEQYPSLLLNFLHRRVGRLWLIARIDIFYDEILGDILTLRHVTIYPTYLIV